MRSRPLASVVSILTLGAAASLGSASIGCATAAEDESVGGAGGATSTTVSGSTASTTVSTTADSSSSSAASTTASSSSSASASSSSTGGGPVCGDGVIESPETCEDQDFNGKTCASFGLSGGTLQCNTFCGIVVSQCTPKESCSNQQDDDQDGDADCDDDECATVAGCMDSCASPKSLSIPTFEFATITGRPDTLTVGCSSGGREMVYSFIAANTADISVDMFFADFDPAVSIRTACGDPATEILCKNDTIGSPSTESFSFPAVAGQQYFLVLEASGNGQGSFDFDISEVQPEFWCDDLEDNDFDGMLDCDDPSDCKGMDFLCQPGSGALGTPCFQPSDCAANQGDPICLNFKLGFSNGYCSEFCDLVANDCPGDGQCADLGLSLNGVCLDGCVTSLDCQPGYVCLDEGLAMKVCDRPPELACNDDHDNDSDGFVDCEDASSCSTSASCVPGAAAAGAPCQLHNECASQSTDPFCIDQFNYGWPGGYCSEFCVLGASDCPSGSVCSGAISPNESSSPNGLCLHTCASQADCRPGFSCASDGTNMVCLN